MKTGLFAVFDSQKLKGQTAGLVFSSLGLVWLRSFCSLETGLTNTSWEIPHPASVATPHSYMIWSHPPASCSILSPIHAIQPIPSLHADMLSSFPCLRHCPLHLASNLQDDPPVEFKGPVRSFCLFWKVRDCNRSALFPDHPRLDLWPKKTAVFSLDRS